MAKIVPAITELDHGLGGQLDMSEWYVLNALRALDDGWLVYVRPQLAAGRPSFVVAHPLHGVCVVEVKDWSVGAYRQDLDGHVERLTPDLGWMPTDERPKARAHRLRSEIIDRFFADAGSPTAKLAVVRAIVVLPRYRTNDARRLLSIPQTGGWGEHSVTIWGGGMLKLSPIAVLTGRTKPVRRKVPLTSFHAMCQLFNESAADSTLLQGVH